MSSTITMGDAAPDFELPTDHGGRISLGDFAGQPVVLYFYSKDFTSGCTTEAISFNEAYDEFKAAGFEVVGVSRDSVASHDRFKEQYDLAFPLASDEEAEVIKAYGAWVPKVLYGRTYMGTNRATFLLDRDHRVKRVWRKVKVPGHASRVLKAAKSLA